MSAEIHLLTYPNKTPPKATNMPIAIAGHVLPGMPCGFSSINPMIINLIVQPGRENSSWMTGRMNFERDIDSYLYVGYSNPHQLHTPQDPHTGCSIDRD